MTPTKKTSLALFASLLLACSDSEPQPEPQPEPHMHQDEPDEPDQPDQPDQPAMAALFELTLVETKLPIAQGGKASATLRVVRKNGFDGAIRIDVSGLPEGVSAAPVELAAGEDTITLELAATAAAPHSLPTEVTFRGVSGDKASIDQATVTVTGLPGALDTSFAAGNAVLPTGAADDYGYAVAVQSDGKVLVAGQIAQNLGDFGLMRLERDGSLDASFGSGGKISTPVGSGADSAHAVAVQKDGKIVVAGVANVTGSGNDFAVVRYLADGKLDASFGKDGIVTTSFGADSDTAYALLIQDDGKIVVGGETSQSSSGSGVDFALARYTDKGQLDVSFGEQGKVITSVAANGGRDTIYALTLHEVAGETRILAAGGEGDFTLARYTDKGELDSSFGTGGKLGHLLGSSIGTARAVQVDSAGRILVAGHHSNDFALMRLGVNGAPDASFGTAGKVITAVRKDNWDAAHAIALLADGRIVLGGWSYDGNSSAGNFALVRYTEEGALDASFGAQGVSIKDISGPTRRDEIRAVALQSDERVPSVRLIAAGFASGSNQDFAVARYWL